MANARQELKELAKALDILTEFRDSDAAKESDLVVTALNEAELNWLRRYRHLQNATARKPAKKKLGGVS